MGGDADFCPVLDPERAFGGGRRGAVLMLGLIRVEHGGSGIAPPAGTDIRLSVQHKGTLPAEGQFVQPVCGPAELPPAESVYAWAGGGRWRVIKPLRTRDLPLRIAEPLLFFTQGGPRCNLRST